MPQIGIGPTYTNSCQHTIYNRKTRDTLPSNTKGNSRTMFMRYLNLAILASAVLSQSAPESANSNYMARQLAGDFDWDIKPEDGFPVIAVDETNEDSAVVFKYKYTGTLSATKYLDVKLYQTDCVVAADASLAFITSITGDELNIDLDIIQETILDSVHYLEIDGTAAAIGFCLRVDYYYVDNDGLAQSVRFYETNVAIAVDLTPSFTLTGISAELTSADTRTVKVSESATPQERSSREGSFTASFTGTTASKPLTHPSPSLIQPAETSSIQRNLD
jgi:hypothetical protein